MTSKVVAGPDLDLRSTVRIDLSRSFNISLEPAWREKQDGGIFIPITFLAKKSYVEKY